MSDEKRPFIAGAKRRKTSKGGVKVDARAEVLKVISVQVQAAIPEDMIQALVGMYLHPLMGGAQGVGAFVNGMFMSVFRDPNLARVVRAFVGAL